MDFSKITSATGGQGTKYRDVAIQAGDLIWAQGTDSGGNCSLTLTNLSAQLVGTVIQDGGRIRTSVWKALADGTARVTIGGSGSNWDLLVTVARPDADNNWTLKYVYDGTVGGSVQFLAKQGNAYFVTQHHGRRVSSSPDIAGISYQIWDDVLPERATSSHHGHMTTFKATSAGAATVSSSRAYVLVCWVEPVARGIFSEFVLV